MRYRASFSQEIWATCSAARFAFIKNGAAEIERDRDRRPSSIPCKIFRRRDVEIERARHLKIRGNAFFETPEQ